jgi:endoglucanase
MAAPAKEKARILAIGRHLAARYRAWPAGLAFELLNEPRDKLSGDLWNVYLAEAIAIVRAVDQNRYLVVGPDNYNSIEGLPRLSLPEDERLILTFHYYTPVEFTFQGHEHLPYKELSGIRWPGGEAESAILRQDFQWVAYFAGQWRLPVFLGEFGVNDKVPISERAAWADAVRRQAEECGFSWAWWEFCSSFGLYDAEQRAWEKPLLEALLSE